MIDKADYLLKEFEPVLMEAMMHNDPVELKICKLIFSSDAQLGRNGASVYVICDPLCCTGGIWMPLDGVMSKQGLYVLRTEFHATS